MTNTSEVSDSKDSDDPQFDYVAPSKVVAKETEEGLPQRSVKTVYEEERDARVSAIVSQEGLKLTQPPKSSAIELLNSPPHMKETRENDEKVDVTDGKKTSNVMLPSTEEARRLRDQRYAIYRRNRYLNQNALREVDPDTRRYMQIVYTPGNNGARQYQNFRPVVHNRSVLGGRKFVPRGHSEHKRARD